MTVSTHMNPAVSIVTPTYNRAHLLPRVWASIVRQTETNLEWIVVDDGSSDDTREVVLGFDDPRIHYVHQENRGVNEARNRGDSMVRSDYVVYLDSDDELLNKTTLAEMLSEVSVEPPKIACVGFTVIDADGHSLFPPCRQNESSRALAAPEQVVDVSQAERVESPVVTHKRSPATDRAREIIPPLWNPHPSAILVAGEITYMINACLSAPFHPPRYPTEQLPMTLHGYNT